MLNWWYQSMEVKRTKCSIQQLGEITLTIQRSKRRKPATKLLLQEPAGEQGMGWGSISKDNQGALASRQGPSHSLGRFWSMAGMEQSTTHVTEGFQPTPGDFGWENSGLAPFNCARRSVGAGCYLIPGTCVQSPAGHIPEGWMLNFGWVNPPHHT